MTFDDLPSVQCTGAEYVDFLTDDETWPDGRFIVQMVNRIDGDWMPDNLRLEDIAPNAVIEISDQGGVADDSSPYLYWPILEFFHDWKMRSVTNASARHD
jgi:glycosyltransferase involved in cell wall biosynthesis